MRGNREQDTPGKGGGSPVTIWRAPRTRQEVDRLLRYGVMQAAFFDLDKTIIAKSSVIAFGGPFYREGLISKRTIVRGIYAQLVYMLVGADEEKMERMREAMLALTKGWDHAARRARSCARRSTR